MHASGATEPPVLTEIGEGIATVRLDRPERLNALADALLVALADELRALDDRDDVRCVVVAGSNRAFAAGADVGELARASALGHYGARARERAWEDIRRVRTPLIAAVSGHCLGGGCELALCCDMVVAAETAVFAQPETGLGLVPGAGGTQRLARAAGKALAMDMVLSGRKLSAAEALAAGLVSRVAPADGWLEEARAMARDVAAKGQVATRLAKESIDRAFEVPLQAGLEVERRSLSLALASDDAAERMGRFLGRGR